MLCDAEAIRVFINTWKAKLINESGQILSHALGQEYNGLAS